MKKESFRILVIDDNEYNLYSLSSLLNKNGFSNVTCLNNGESALKYLIENGADLIILDIQMPTIDGFETARLLKMSKKSSTIPIVFITAIFNSEECIRKGFEIGAIDYILKPVEEFLFIKRIGNYYKMIAQDKLLERLGYRLDIED